MIRSLGYLDVAGQMEAQLRLNAGLTINGCLRQEDDRRIENLRKLSRSLPVRHISLAAFRPDADGLDLYILLQRGRASWVRSPHVRPR